MLHPVKSLTAGQRIAIESLLGRRVSESESINLQVLKPEQLLPAGISQEQRTAALASLLQYFDKVDSRRADVSQEEEDAILDEAMRSIKPTYKSVL